MSKNIDEVLAQVQKMLNVQGRTPEEAAAYVEKAHAILAQYDLTIEDIGELKADPRTSIAKSDTAATATQGKPDGWKSDLLRAVAEAFDCRVIVSYETEWTKTKQRLVKEYRLVGFKHDLEAAHYAHSFLVGEVTRLAKAYARVAWDEIAALAKERGISHHDAESEYTWSNGTHPLKQELYFTKGATQTIMYEVVTEARKRRAAEAEVNPHAMVLQKSDAIEDFVGRERWGDKWDDIKKQRAEAEAKRANETTIQKAWDSQDQKQETPKQRAARERRERKQQERWERAYWREQEKIDHSALAAGQEAGRGLKVRPGVGSAEGREAIG
jgi:hypothetical protein